MVAEDTRELIEHVGVGWGGGGGGQFSSERITLVVVCLLLGMRAADWSRWGQLAAAACRRIRHHPARSWGTRGLASRARHKCVRLDEVLGI